MFVEGTTCPNCEGTEFTETWKGKIVVMKPEESVMAKKLKIEKPGTYAIKIR